MAILGLRCSNKNFAYVVLSGKKESPKLVNSGLIEYPKGYSRPDALKWTVQEVENLIARFKILGVVMKSFEGRTRNKTFEVRVEHEAAVYLACSNKAIRLVKKKVKSTIAKDLGFKGKAHYLVDTLDTSIIPGFDQFDDKIKDATLAAWSELK